MQPKLINGDVKNILIKMTFPMIFGMLGMVMFNLVDTFFIGKLGTKELAAISYTFPVIFVLQSLALGMGIGTSSAVSMAIGRKSKALKRLTSDALMLSLIVAAIVMTIGLFTIQPLFSLLGATPDIIVLIEQYMKVWYWGVLFVIIPMVGNNAIRATGDTKTPAIMMVFSLGLNIILDPIFIFGLFGFPRLEMQGAAIATVISRAASMVVAFSILYFREKMITLKPGTLKETLQNWKTVMEIGFPTALSRMIVPIGAGVITAILSRYGHEAVAGLGVGTRIEFFAMALIMALSTALGPFIGQNWAAKKKDRVREAIRISNSFTIRYGFALFIIAMLTADYIARLFSSDPIIVSYTALYIRTVSIAWGAQGMIMISTNSLNILRAPIKAAIISIVQTFCMMIPFAYIGAYFLKTEGIFIAITVSYLLTSVIANTTLKRLIREEKA
ncbi:MATE family efflux transporter [Candidatus Woesearchaeota archaeon]|nr:MATE family efflux transporter [Candidatus Woesearchaeota archaeon]